MLATLPQARRQRVTRSLILACSWVTAHTRMKRQTVTRSLMLACSWATAHTRKMRQTVTRSFTGAPLPPYPRGSYVAATACVFRFGASRVLALLAAECSLAPVAVSLSVGGSLSEYAMNMAPCSVGFCPRCRSIPSFMGLGLSALPRV